MSKSYLILSRIGLVVGFLFVALSTAQALPALQLGPDTSDPLWTYDDTTQTWVWGGLPTDTATWSAFANQDGGSGDYAWDAAGATTQTAYLVIAAVPQINFNGFDVTIENDGNVLSLFTSDVGSPPLQDPNSMAPHGIFDTYFEIYEFNFDGGVTTIDNTQPGQMGIGPGFEEEFDIIFNSLLAGVTGLHIDLFTVSGDGILDLSASSKKIVKAFAPFSHDAELTPVPIPAALPLLASALGLMGFLGWRRKRVAA